MDCVEVKTMQIGEVKCHNEKCGCEFFPRTRVGLKTTRCPKCGWSVPLEEGFQFNPQIIADWIRYNHTSLQIEGGL